MFLLSGIATKTLLRSLAEAPVDIASDLEVVSTLDIIPTSTFLEKYPECNADLVMYPLNPFLPTIYIDLAKRGIRTPSNLDAGVLRRGPRLPRQAGGPAARPPGTARGSPPLPPLPSLPSLPPLPPLPPLGRGLGRQG